MNKEQIFEAIKGGLIVSCQALPDEPLHSSFIMGRMAYAAKLGGAVGIRCNSVEDIKEIKTTVDLPLIGLIKQDYEGCKVRITPTMNEVDALAQVGVDIIAMDATNRPRPDGRSIAETFPEVRAKYPDQLFMADCATYEEAVQAQALGFDLVGTTMNGYTDDTRHTPPPNFDFMRKLAENLTIPVVAEGGIFSPEQLRTAMDQGVHACVVGSAITRPMKITQRYVKALEK
ncbi:MAG: N-acetylmannosamine-6-phosphate 2-epimerase [Ruminococcaceae bacterium]|nr:N-acetylmannosamine-6-phosphate 2-epimerase [Oscillospiraceae bacterium]